jgi:DNA-binding NtrC family response regulator
MPLALQSKLLRVLQEQELEPLGSNQVQRIDVRVIAATSRDLAAMVAAGSFRADLYYRLNVLPIRLPPLRERLDDLEALVEALAEDIARRTGLPHKSLSPDALDLLARHDWPGNIRELRNVLEQATLMTDDAVLGARHFGALAAALGPAVPAAAAGAAHDGADRATSAGQSGGRAALGNGETHRDGEPGRGPPTAAAVPAAATPPAFKPLPQAVAELETQAIRDALQRCAGNKLAAAKLLGISRATLYQKLPALGTPTPQGD